MSSKNILILGGILSMLSVMIGAFGAHGLAAILEANDRTDTFETAVKYQFYHALGILLIGVLSLQIQHQYLLYAPICMLVGIILFSGSLYVLCLTNIRVLGAVTPFGGVAFIIGWGLMIVGVYQSQNL